MDSLIKRLQEAESGSREALVEKLKTEYERRSAAKEGCGRCCYCDLGADELCRHYDLDLRLMDFDATLQSQEPTP